MVQFLKKNILLSLVLLLLIVIVTACANMATPSGGSYDLDPPVVLRSSPSFNATNVTKGKVVIEFDENVTIEKPSENVIITPPQQSFPTIHSVNKKVVVELRDSLLPNTTYTIDFTNSIVDNNEKNPIENFSFSFSTGDVVDSLSVSGKVLNAENLEPVKGMYVGLHSNLEDSAFTKLKFERISRTNESGGFTIKGVAPGKYRLYALDDTNRDYKYDNPAEAIAFMETVLEPTSELAVRFDTLYVDTTRKVIDTIKQVNYTRFLPDNIMLRSFKSGFQRQYLQKYERTPDALSIFFGAPTTMPELEALSFEDSKDWYVLEKTLKNDTLIYWVKDKELMKMDTLAFRITYPRTDSLNQSVPFTDTIKFVDRTRKKSEKELEREQERLEKEQKERERRGLPPEEPKITFLDITHNLSSSWDTYKNITLEFKEPIIDSLQSKLVLQQLKDSVYHDISYQLEKDSINPRKFIIKYRWVYEGEYQLQMDSAAIYSIYGLWNNKLEQKFKVKAEDQYGQLAIRVAGVDSIPCFMELLDKSDKPVRKVRIRNNAAVFRDLIPGTYYTRIILDENNNGIWDTGDYDKKIQPEMVCYSPKEFVIKEFFIHDEPEPWIIDPSTLANQKPLVITKQKPQEKNSRRKQLEEMEQKNNQQSRSQSTDNNMNANSRNTGDGMSIPSSGGRMMSR